MIFKFGSHLPRGLRRTNDSVQYRMMLDEGPTSMETTPGGQKPTYGHVRVFSRAWSRITGAPGRHSRDVTADVVANHHH